MSIILFGLSYLNKDKIINYGDKQGGVLNNKKLDIKESGISTSFVRNSTTKSNSKTIPTEINDSRTVPDASGTVTGASGTVTGASVTGTDASVTGTDASGNGIGTDASGNGTGTDASGTVVSGINYPINNDVYNYIFQLGQEREELKKQLEKSKETTEPEASVTGTDASGSVVSGINYAINNDVYNYIFQLEREREELKKQLEKSKETTEVNSSENLSSHFFKHTKEIENLKKKLIELGIDKSDDLSDLILQLYEEKKKAEQLLQKSKELPENDSTKLNYLDSQLKKIGLNITNDNLSEKINELKEYQEKLENNFLKQKNISKEYEVEKNILLNKLNKIKINIEKLREDENSKKIQTLTEIENLKKAIEISKKAIGNLQKNSYSKDEEIIELQNYTKNLESLFFQLNIEKKKLILMNTMKEKEKYLKDIENQFEKSQLKNKFNLFKCFIENYFEIEEIKDNAIKIDEKLNLIYKLNNLKEDFKKEKNSILKNTNDNKLKNFINNLSKDFKQKIKGLLEELTKNIE